MKPLEYLACPYTHELKSVREFRFQMVNKVAGILMSRGHKIFSPISHTHPIAEVCDLPGDWEYWQEYDRAFISCCSKLYVLMLPGWKESTGVQAEIKIAEEMGVPVEHLEPAEFLKEWGLHLKSQPGDSAIRGNMELTKDNFEDLLKRLHYHNIGAGVREHGTANPIFNVQCKRRIYGLDSGYTDKSLWVDSGREREWDDIESLFEDIEEEETRKILNLAKVRNVQDFLRLYDYEQEICLGKVGIEEVYYEETWEYVNSHLTKEAAKAFIERKKHDYGELRIWTGSLYWCWEFKAIVEGLIDGKIGLLEQSDAAEAKSEGD